MRAEKTATAAPRWCACRWWHSPPHPAPPPCCCCAAPAAPPHPRPFTRSPAWLQGALVGAAHGQSGIPRRFIEELHDSTEIAKEIDAYCTALYPEAAAAAGGSPATPAAAGEL